MGVSNVEPPVSVPSYGFDLSNDVSNALCAADPKRVNFDSSLGNLHVMPWQLLFRQGASADDKYIHLSNARFRVRLYVSSCPSLRDLHPALFFDGESAC